MRDGLCGDDALNYRRRLSGNQDGFLMLTLGMDIFGMKDVLAGFFPVANVADCKPDGRATAGFLGGDTANRGRASCN